MLIFKIIFLFLVMQIRNTTMETINTQSVSSIQEFSDLITRWYDENYQGFADKFNAAVKGVNPIPAGTDSSVAHSWAGAGIQDLCSFFASWYEWNPGLSTGLEYIQRFSWLYYENPKGLEFVSTAPGNLMTKLYVDLNGEKMDSSESIGLVDQWMKQVGDKMHDYIIPEGGYMGFNDFFARELKPGKRPISAPDDDSVVVSPADAIVNMIADNLVLTDPLPVKTRQLNVLQLLDNSPLAKVFEGGTAVSNILMPDVYHRYHAPVTGMVVESNEDVAGNYFGINDFPKLLDKGNVGYGYDYSVFEHFRRGYLIIKTEKFGHVAMIPVGLNTIASVIFLEKFRMVNPANPVPVYKGEEIGLFYYGGSLNILLFEKGCFPSIRVPQGQMIGTMIAKG
jgi:phosphatidylserine decarboxylase